MPWANGCPQVGRAPIWTMIGLCLLSFAGCQVNGTGMSSPPAGLGTPHNSMFKPTPEEPLTPAGNPTNLPGQTNSSNTLRVRGQTPDDFNRSGGATLGSSRQPLPTTDATRANGLYGSNATFSQRNAATPNQSQYPISGSSQPLLSRSNDANSRFTGQSTLNPNVPTRPGVTNNVNTQSSAATNPAYTATNPGGPAIGGNGQRVNATFASGPNSNNLPGQFVQYTQPPVGQPAYQPPLQSAPPQGYAGQPPAASGYPNAAPPPAYVNPYAGSNPTAPLGQQAMQDQGVPYGQTTPYQSLPGDYGSTIAPGAMNAPSQSTIAPGALGVAEDPAITTYQPRERIAPIDVWVQEARTGRVMIGGSVNSDLGLSAQVTVDERNFDIRRFPRSWSDLWEGRAFRGNGESFRLELMPGTQVQRYTVNWTQRNLLGYLPYSLSLGGFLYTRQYRDWTEQRLGGRAALGYEITKDLSISTELRMEDVKLFDPRVNTVDQLNRALGSSDLYTGRIRLAHDTRDSPFMSTEGHLMELIYDQTFGEFDYPRGMLNYSRYFLVKERPDGGGRHTLASTWKFGVSGSDTPIFENFFAGGYSTMRGFRFRGASPVVNDVQVGGRFMFLGSLEYIFPLTADEMLRGVAFVDYGTIERDITLNSENFRVAPGLGLRVAIPALGPAPLAFDFAVPVNKADGDQTQIFSFFMGFTR